MNEQLIDTGEIKDAICLSIEDEPLIKFIYCTIVSESLGRFNAGYWTATVQIIKLDAADNVLLR